MAAQVAIGNVLLTENAMVSCHQIRSGRSELVTVERKPQAVQDGAEKRESSELYGQFRPVSFEVARDQQREQTIGPSDRRQRRTTRTAELRQG